MTSTAFPRRQHYIPKTLLKHFCDDDGWLWVGTRATGAVFRQRPQNVFVKNHVYTRHSYDGSPPSAEYERSLSGIENNAAPVIDRILGFARRLEPIDVSPTELRALQRFIFALACRTPESQQRVSRRLSDEDFYNIVRERAQMEGIEDLPDRDIFYADRRIKDLTRRIRHNVDASFAAGDDSRIQDEWNKFKAETGVRFAVIHGPDKSFAIGSHGITNCDYRIVGRKLAGGVLPIAHDVLAHLTPWPCTPGLFVLNDTSQSSHAIDAVNAATTTQSAMIACRSEEQIYRLLEQRGAVTPETRGNRSHGSA